MEPDNLAHLLGLSAGSIEQSGDESDCEPPETSVVLCVLVPQGVPESVPDTWRSVVGLLLDPPYGYVLADASTAEAMQCEVDVVLSPERICISPPVSAQWLREAARLTRRLHELADAGVVADGDVLDCADHELPLWLYAEPLLRQRLGERLLAPLEHESAGHRRILSQTLLAWLGRRRGTGVMATELGIHPQTVRYRVRRLQAMFGDALEDPETSFAMLLALKAVMPLWEAGIGNDLKV